MRRYDGHCMCAFESAASVDVLTSPFGVYDRPVHGSAAGRSFKGQTSRPLLPSPPPRSPA